MEPSPGETLERLVAGSRTAAAWLYDAFAPRLYRRLRQRYGYLGEAEIEDLLQETFLVVLRNERRVLAAFLDRRQARPIESEEIERFLWDEACGLASNRRRSAAVRKVVSLEDYAEAATAPRAEARAVDRDAVLRLVACLKESGARLHLYFKLRFHDGLTPDEISRVTGWSLKTTYKLRQYLNEAVLRCVEALRLFGDSRM